MTWRKKIIGASLLLLLLVAWPIAEQHQTKARLAAYRQKLIAQGEKLTTAELTPLPPTGENGAPRFLRAANALLKTSWDITSPPAMEMIKAGATRVIWQEEEPFCYTHYTAMKTNLWPFFRRQIETNQFHLAEIRAALDEPAFYFRIDYSPGHGTLFPHVSPMRTATTWLTTAALVDLHEGKIDEAWENLRAAIALPGLYSGDLASSFQELRAKNAEMAFRATWEALQFEGWTEAQLAEWQAGWQRLDFISQMEPTMAMERAWGILIFPICRQAYPFNWGTPKSINPMTEWVEYGKELFTSPGSALRNLTERYPAYWAWTGWWSYDEEIAFCEVWQANIEASRMVRRQKSFGQAVAQMEKTEGETRVHYASHGYRFLITPALMPTQSGFLRKIAQAQTMKEMMVAVIALKRFQLRQGKSASHLRELVPDFLPELPNDYFVGQPLRYRLQDDGTFLLYAVGENGQDDGGDASPEKNVILPQYLKGRDLVWPRPATTAEVKAFEEERMARQLAQKARYLSNEPDPEAFQEYQRRYGNPVSTNE